MFFYLLQQFMYILPVLLNVAFITLLERKVLSYTQNRKGPNKVSFLGVFQPFADAIKLFSKELTSPSKSNFLMFLISPAVLMLLMLTFWLVLPMEETSFLFNFSLILFLSFLSLNIYPFFFSGWGSNSKYAMIGAIRGISQTISYEISLALILLSICLLGKSLSLTEICKWESYLVSTGIFFPVLITWLISCVAETNRTPFDFSEGESELVSGFNIEYGGFLFAILFMSEYGMILLFSGLTNTLFFMGYFSSILSLIILVNFCFFWIWLRASYPRFRYDKLMMLGWKILLPFILLWIFYVVSLFCL